jgi:hypothetical protein
VTKNKPRARGVEPHAGPFKGGAELRVEAEKRAMQNAQLDNPLAQEFANAFRENFFGGHEIFIPRGLKVLAAGRIPAWVADATIQIPAEIEYKVFVEKKVPTEVPNYFYLEKPDLEDMHLLAQIWQGMPDYSIVKPERFSKEYMPKFNASPLKPVWGLSVIYWNNRSDYEKRQLEVQYAQHVAIDTLIKSGELEALDQNLVKTRDGLKFGTKFRTEVARQYLSTIGFELKEVDMSELAQKATRSPRGAEEWPVEKIKEAQARRLELLGEGRKDFHAQTAKEFGVSGTRLRDHLNKLEPKKNSRKLDSVWGSKSSGQRKK